MPSHRVFWLATPLCLIWTQLASTMPDYQYATDQCHPQQATGFTNFCSCTGYCRDGTALGDAGGQCQYWWNSCLDHPQASCSSNQVFKNHQKQVVDQGSCGSGSDASCFQAQYMYTWDCCDCPPGYTSWGQNCDGPTTYCLKCLTAGDKLKYNPNSQNYICDGPSFRKKACDMVNANAKLLDTVSTGTTILGGLCPTQGVFGVAAKLIGLAINGFQLAKNQGSAFSHQLSALTAMESLMIGALVVLAAPVEIEAASVAATLVFAYGLTCSVVGGLSTLLTAAKIYGNLDATCPQGASKRFELLDGTVRDTASHSHIAVYERTDLSNPCADLFISVPTVFDTPASIDAACVGIQPYYIQDTLEAGVANTTFLLSQFCSQLSASGNNTILAEYTALLSAIYDAIPYCYLTANGTATTLDAFSTQVASSTTLGRTSLSTSIKTSSTASSSKSSSSTGGTKIAGTTSRSPTSPSASTSRTTSRSSSTTSGITSRSSASMSKTTSRSSTITSSSKSSTSKPSSSMAISSSKKTSTTSKPASSTIQQSVMMTTTAKTTTRSSSSRTSTVSRA